MTSAPHISTVRTRLVWSLAILLLGVHFVLAWNLRPPGIGIGHDDAQYLALAESMRDLSYRDVFLADSPTHHMYPPTYPTLILIWDSLIARGNIDYLTLLGILCSTLALGFLFAILIQSQSIPVALFSLLVLALNPILLDFAGSIMAEAPYLLFSILCLYCLSRPQPTRKIVFLAAVLAIIAALTRSIGIALLITVGLQLILSRRFAGLVVFVLATIPTVGGWLYWSLVAPTKVVGRSYIADATRGMGATSPVQVLIDRVTHHLPIYIGEAIPNAMIFPTVSGTPVDNFVVLAFLLTGLLFGIPFLYRDWRPAGIYLAAFSSILIVWPWFLGRFIIPLLPVFVPMWLAGIEAIGRRFSPKAGMICVFAAGGFLAVNAAMVTTEMLERHLAISRDTLYPLPIHPDKPGSIGQVSFFEAVEYIKQKHPIDSIYVTGKPASFYYHTRRKSIERIFSGTIREEGFLKHLRTKGVDYVLLSHVHSVEWENLARRMRKNCEAFYLEASFPPATYLFRLAEPGIRAADLQACAAVAQYEADVAVIFAAD
jgi:hypothetical protein